jgi:hypothetical protein
MSRCPDSPLKKSRASSSLVSAMTEVNHVR